MENVSSKRILFRVQNVSLTAAPYQINGMGSRSTHSILWVGGLGVKILQIIVKHFYIPTKETMYNYDLITKLRGGGGAPAPLPQGSGYAPDGQISLG